MRSKDMFCQYDALSDMIIAGNDFYIYKPAILVDTDGVLLKFGNDDECMEHHRDRFTQAGFHVLYLVFDRARFSMDQICTIINYALNSHSVLCLFTKETQEHEIKDLINSWRVYGY